MNDAVTLHHLYYLIDTSAWLAWRIGDHHGPRSTQLQDFIGSNEFDGHQPATGTAARMRLWCSAHGLQVGDGGTIEHDNAYLTDTVTIVLAADPSGRALALVAVHGRRTQIYTDITTDAGYWRDACTIQITCPNYHGWTWDGGRELHTTDGTQARVRDLFGAHDTVISRCRDCSAFDDGHTAAPCRCPGHAIYCPKCGQRCNVTLPEVPTHQRPPR